MKLLKIIFLAIGMSLIVSVTLAQKVGDPMPEYDLSAPIRSFDRWGHPENLFWGWRFFYEDKILVFMVCNDGMADKPFGIVDLKTMTLYLDNAPTDGIIDKVIKNPGGRFIHNDAPGCGQKILMQKRTENINAETALWLW